MGPSRPTSETAPAAGVFVSYAREDGEDAATVLRERLESEAPDLDVWQDRARMEAGRGWWSQLAEAIDRSGFLVLVMTPAAFRSSVMRREWRHARQRGVCVIPVLPADTAADFQALPRWMRKAHVHDLGSATEWATLLQRLRGACHVPRVPFMAGDPPPRYVARASETERVRNAVLGPGGGDPGGGLVVVHGPGGFGKTTLVTALCHREDVQEAFDDGILWTTLGEGGSATEALSVLYRALTGRPAPFVDADEGAAALAGLLGDRHCLIVIDDLWDPAHLPPFLRGAEGCLRLVTTRRSDLAVEDGALVEVGEMTPEEARTLVAFGLDDALREGARLEALTRRLGEWPLVLELAAAALRQRLARGDNAAGALRYLEAALDAEGVVAFDSRDSSARERAVSRTLEVSLRLLETGERRRYEELSAFPGDVDVPLSAVERLWDMAPLDAERLCERLADLSLLHLDLGASTVRIHGVVDAYLERLVADPSRLHGRLVDAWGDPRALPDAYSWRWYAHHLQGAGRIDALRRILFDAEWLGRRVEAGGIATLVDDFRRIPGGKAAGEGNAGAAAVAATLSLAAHVVSADSNQLSAQLLARLDRETGPDVARLLEGASRGPGGPWLRPLRRSLAAPGGPLVRTLRASAPVKALAVAPDGHRAVVATEAGGFEVWDLTTGERVRTLPPAGDVPARGWHFTLVAPDGRRAVTAPYPFSSAEPSPADRRLRLLDLEAGEGPPAVVASPDVALRAAALTPDGGVLVAATVPDDRIRGWSLEDGRELFATDAGTAAPFQLAASAAAGLILWTTAEGIVRLDRVGHLPGPPIQFGEMPWKMALSADGTRLVTWTLDGVLEVWDLARGVRLSHVEGLPYGAMAMTPEGRYVAVGGALEGGAWVVDAVTGRVLLSLPTERIAAAALTPGGGRLLLASGDIVRVLDVADSPHRPDGGDQPVTTLAALPASAAAVGSAPPLAVSADEGGRVKVWSTASGSPERTTTLHDAAITAIAVLPGDEGRIVTASEDGTLVSWRPREGRDPVRLRGHEGPVTAVLALDEGRVASGSGDGTLRLWEPTAGHQITSVTIRRPHDLVERFRVAALGPTGAGDIAVVSLAEMPDLGKIMRSLYLWSLPSGELAELDTLFARHVSEAFAAVPGGGIVAATRDDRIRLWEPNEGGLREGPVLEVGFATALAVAPGGPVLVGTDAGEVRAWNPRTGHARTLAVHESTVSALAVAPGGRLGASASEDGRIRFLDLRGGRELVGFHGDGAVTACVWLSDDVLVAGERLGRVHVLAAE